MERAAVNGYCRWFLAYVVVQPVVYAAQAEIAAPGRVTQHVWWVRHRGGRIMSALIYLDDLNLWIEGKKVSAVSKGMALDIWEASLRDQDV